LKSNEAFKGKIRGMEMTKNFKVQVMIKRVAKETMISIMISFAFYVFYSLSLAVSF